MPLAYVLCSWEWIQNNRKTSEFNGALWFSYFFSTQDEGMKAQKKSVTYLKSQPVSCKTNKILVSKYERVSVCVLMLLLYSLGRRNIKRRNNGFEWDGWRYNPDTCWVRDPHCFVFCFFVLLNGNVCFKRLLWGSIWELSKEKWLVYCRCTE